MKDNTFFRGIRGPVGSIIEINETDSVEDESYKFEDKCEEVKEDMALYLNMKNIDKSNLQAELIIKMWCYKIDINIMNLNEESIETKLLEDSEISKLLDEKETELSNEILILKDKTKSEKKDKKDKKDKKKKKQKQEDSGEIQDEQQENKQEDKQEEQQEDKQEEQQENKQEEQQEEQEEQQEDSGSPDIQEGGELFTDISLEELSSITDVSLNSGDEFSEINY